MSDKSDSGDGNSREVVKTTNGSIKGSFEDGMYSYLGVPYAAPPTGDLRWRPPQPLSGWKETRQCTQFAAACPQNRSKFLWVGEMSEDCLYLNIWTKNPDPGAKMPVMFWLQGGGFQTGSAGIKLYDGTNLAEQDVVIVTADYRVGPLGFLAHPALSDESTDGISGNYGLLDQIAALEWVRDNIEAFGGDPSRVTAFGFSSGADSVIDLMVSERASGLFSGAIIQSCSPWVKVGLPAASLPLSEGEQIGKKFEKALGLNGTGNNISKMREIETAVLLEIAGSDGVFVKEGMVFCPVVDGSVMKAHPMALFSEQKQADIPLIIGSNLNEANLFLYLVEFTKMQYEFLIRMVSGPYADKVLEMYPAQNDEEAVTVFETVMTAGEFTAPARFVAKCMTQKSHNPYLYQFSGHREGHPLKACHGSEVSYVFGNLSKTKCDDSDRELSRIMMGYWLNFAKTGDPNGENLPEWPAFDLQTEGYINLGKPVTAEKGLWTDICDLSEMVHTPIFMDIKT